MLSPFNNLFVKIGVALTLVYALLAILLANISGLGYGNVWSKSLIWTIAPCCGIWSTTVVFATQSDKVELVIKLVTTLVLCSILPGTLLPIALDFITNSEPLLILVLSAMGLNLSAHIVTVVVCLVIFRRASPREFSALACEQKD